jgi:hypothetical protein
VVQLDFHRFMKDETEPIRRARLIELNTSLDQEEAGRRAELEAQFGQVWDKDQLREQFVVTGFMAPYVVVREIKSGKVGSLEFCHMPRFYFNWQEDK